MRFAGSSMTSYATCRASSTRCMRCVARPFGRLLLEAGALVEALQRGVNECDATRTRRGTGNEAKATR